MCEDSKSCLLYLRDAAHHFRSHAEVEISHCGKTDPKGIVNEAQERLKHFDDVYCAIDRDNHEGFDEALTIARGSGVKVIASYPCYEFWLLLHFRFTRAPQTAVGGASAGDRMVDAIKGEEGMAHYDKGAGAQLFQLLLRRLPAARQRAIQVLNQALDDGEMNPSTHLHQLIDVLEALAMLRPAGDS